MENPYYESGASFELYYRPALEPVRHPVSQELFTEPGVSSIIVCVDELERPEQEWHNCHFMHAEPDDEECDPELVRFGLLPDFDPDLDGGDPDKPWLMVCCGTKRPRGKELRVRVEAAADYVTVHDLLSAVHPQLMARREDLLRAVSTESEPPSPETKLMVLPDKPSVISVMLEYQWLNRTTKRERKHPWEGFFIPTTLNEDGESVPLQGEEIQLW